MNSGNLSTTDSSGSTSVAASLAEMRHEVFPHYVRHLVSPGILIIKGLNLGPRNHALAMGHKEATEGTWLQPIPRLFEDSLVPLKEPHL